MLKSLLASRLIGLAAGSCSIGKHAAAATAAAAAAGSAGAATAAAASPLAFAATAAAARQWPMALWASPPSTCTARTFSTSTSTSVSTATTTSSTPAAQLPPLSPRRLRAKAGLEYSRARAEWRRQVGALRRQWLEELRAARAAKAEADAADAEQRKALAALRRRQEGRAKRKDRLLRDIAAARQQYREALHVVETASRTKRRDLLVEQYNQLRREQLLARSRYWIPREEFEERVQRALDNPVTM